MISFDNEPAKLTQKDLQKLAVSWLKDQQTAPAPAPVSAAIDAMPGSAPELTLSGGSGMIFLRRDANGWLVRFLGIRGLGANELPIPGDRTAKLPAVLAYLKEQHGAKLAGAWLLIAP